jgi:hypothetical protein
MSRLILVAAVLASAAPALADDDIAPAAVVPATSAPAPAPVAPAPSTTPVTAGPSEQGIGAMLGLASGAHLTPGGLRVAGHYTYQLTEHEWFDGTAAFTYGGGSPGCYTNRDGGYTCDHGLLDGRGVEVVIAVRHYFPSQGQFRPFARGGVGLGIARYGGADDVTGGTLALHAGGGMRVEVADAVAVVAEADLVLGAGAFGHGIGLGGQLGLAVIAGAEFRL